MAFNTTTYHAIDTPVHALDARIKILLLLAYSVALFLVQSWTGVAVMALLFAFTAGLAKLEVRRVARQLLPVGFLLLVTLLANTFVADVYADAPTLGAVSSGVFANMPSIALAGNFGISPAGFARGCFYVARIVLLLGASLVLTTTSTTTQLARALESFLSPLAHVGFPVRDASTVISLALRFIPVTVDQFQSVRAAQSSRAAQFDTGGLGARLRAWGTVFIPLFVGLFRRADDLSKAMDARAYGMGASTQLDKPRLKAGPSILLLAGCATLLFIGWLL